jgi:hypothetical protein
MAGIPAAWLEADIQKSWFSVFKHHFTGRCIRTTDKCRHSTGVPSISVLPNQYLLIDAKNDRKEKSE